MDNTWTDIIIAIGTIVLAVAALYGMFVEYRRRLNIKRKSYLSRQVSLFNNGLKILFSELFEKEEDGNVRDRRLLKWFVYEVNSLLTTTIFTAEALKYKEQDGTEKIIACTLHKKFIFFNDAAKNERTRIRINDLSAIVDNFYEEKIRRDNELQFNGAFSFYLEIKDSLLEVSNAIR